MARPKGSKSLIAQDLREVITAAFHKVGGREYLVRLSRTRPELFVQLIAKIIPSEARLAITASYVPREVRVEAREPLPALPAPAASNAIDAQFTVAPAREPEVVSSPTTPLEQDLDSNHEYLQPFDL